MPGYNNRIPYNQFEMTNWWQFTDDWDLCYAQNIGLYGSATGIQGNVVPDINIFMVPSQDKLIIDLNGNRAEVSIYSIDNKLIKTDVITNGANEIDLYDLISGIYFLKIQNGHQIFVKKFLR
jgi:hypothetical protein